MLFAYLEILKMSRSYEQNKTTAKNRGKYSPRITAEDLPGGFGIKRRMVIQKKGWASSAIMWAVCPPNTLGNLTQGKEISK